MRILFLHGWQSVPGGVKPTFLVQHGHEVINPKLPDEDFAEVAESSAIPVLVDLWAPWCGPCRMVSPALEQLARERAGQLKLVKVNVDDAPNLAQRFSVQGVPTLLVMVGGQEIARQVGAAPEHALRSWLEKSLERTSP